MIKSPKQAKMADERWLWCYYDVNSCKRLNPVPWNAASTFCVRLSSPYDLDLIWWANDDLIWTIKSLSGKWNHVRSTKIWSELQLSGNEEHLGRKTGLLFGPMSAFPAARSRNKLKRNTSGYRMQYDACDTSKSSTTLLFFLSLTFPPVIYHHIRGGGADSCCSRKTTLR